MILLSAFIGFIRERWSFVTFVGYLVIAVGIQQLLQHHGYQLPEFAVFEVAALVHVFEFAWKMMDFKGFTYVSRRFNSLTKKCVLVIVGFLLFAKVVIIFVETKEVTQGGGESLITFAGSATIVETGVHSASKFIMVAPLLLFILVNCIAWWRVRKESGRLGLVDTGQEKMLRKLIIQVDVPPIVLYLVVLLFIKVGESSVEMDTLLRILGCSALVLSNWLVGPFVNNMKEAPTAVASGYGR